MGNVKLNEILHEKNDLIIQQTRRINYLEEKLLQLRKKYFRLKYEDQTSFNKSNVA